MTEEFKPTHKRSDTGELVKATIWKKDGDHPMVERYPIEGRREYKGLLAVDAKTKFALRFGDAIIEDKEGRIYVVDNRRLKDDKGKIYPSLFETNYDALQEDQA